MVVTTQVVMVDQEMDVDPTQVVRVAIQGQNGSGGNSGSNGNSGNYIDGASYVYSWVATGDRRGRSSG